MADFLMVDPPNHTASNYFIEFEDRDGKHWYVTTIALWYKSERYNRYVVCQQYFVSDGATGAYDIDSFGWLFHDKLCDTGKFNDDTRCTNWEASSVVSDILEEEGRWVRTKTWKYATFLFGGDKARKNGMLKLSPA